MRDRYDYNQNDQSREEFRGDRSYQNAIEEERWRNQGGSGSQFRGQQSQYDGGRRSGYAGGFNRDTDWDRGNQWTEGRQSDRDERRQQFDGADRGEHYGGGRQSSDSHRGGQNYGGGMSNGRGQQYGGGEERYGGGYRGGMERGQQWSGSSGGGMGSEQYDGIYGGGNSRGFGEGGGGGWSGGGSRGNTMSGSRSDQGFEQAQRGYSSGQWQQDRGPHYGKGPKGYQRSDDRIKEDLSDRLSRHGGLDASDIEMDVNQGDVTLRGNVDSRESKRLAEDLCDDCHGVKNVSNQLKVRDRSDDTSAGSSSSGMSKNKSDKSDKSH